MKFDTAAVKPNAEARIKEEAKEIGITFASNARLGARCAIYGYRAAESTPYKIKLVTKSELIAAGDLDVASLVDRYNPALEVVVCAYDAAAGISYLGILHIGMEGAGDVHSYFVAREDGQA